MTYDTIETHYAPEKAQCPNCNKKGEMTYNDETNSFYCCICGTNHEINDLPKTVKLWTHYPQVVATPGFSIFFLDHIYTNYIMPYK